MLSKFVTIHAAALAVVAACEPAPGGDVSTAAEETTESSAAGPNGAKPAASAAPPSEAEPGFTGEWAFEEADCGKPTSTFRLSGAEINMTPRERACSVKSIDEQHPTGRSAIFVVQASCLAEGETSEDRFRLEFGASDTVMQLQLNDRDPIRLVRCPAN
jgi:hypothetical protein